MKKIEIRRNTFLTPMPVVLVGAKVDGRVNFMAVGWVSRVNHKPPMVAVGINNGHHTPKGILETGEFSVNVPGAELLQATDYCGVVSGKTTDKSGLFEVFYGKLEGAPMIAACPLNLECKLVRTVDLPTNHLFIGEIVGAHCDEELVTDGRPDIRKMNPFFLTMPDNRYWSVGDFLGSAWSIGRDYNPTDASGKV